MPEPAVVLELDPEEADALERLLHRRASYALSITFPLDRVLLRLRAAR